jgi:hypothetical protein
MTPTMLSLAGLAVTLVSLIIMIAVAWGALREQLRAIAADVARIDTMLEAQARADTRVAVLEQRLDHIEAELTRHTDRCDGPQRPRLTRT